MKQLRLCFESVERVCSGFIASSTLKHTPGAHRTACNPPQYARVGPNVINPLIRHSALEPGTAPAASLRHGYRLPRAVPRGDRLFIGTARLKVTRRSNIAPVGAFHYGNTPVRLFQPTPNVRLGNFRSTFRPPFTPKPCHIARFPCLTVLDSFDVLRGMCGDG